MGLLREILETQSVSSNSNAMRSLIISNLKKMPDVMFRTDDADNIYAIKGTLLGSALYPAFACHTDTAQDIVENYKVERSGDAHIWHAFTEDKLSKRIVGIGGEGKCGVFLCLKLLDKLPVVKCIFFADKEIGAIGAQNADMSFFNDCRWLVECDTKGDNNIITEADGVTLCSPEFKADSHAVGKKWGYKPTSGQWTDVTILKKNRYLTVSAINISAGFYKPRTQFEFIHEKGVLKAFEFCRSLSNKLTDRYLHRSTQTTIVNGKRMCKSDGCTYPVSDPKKEVCESCFAVAWAGAFDRCGACRERLTAKEELKSNICNKCITKSHPSV